EPKQPCVFPTFTDEDPEECSPKTQRLTSNAWEKVTNEYKLDHPWLHEGDWLCTRHFSRATITIQRTAGRAQGCDDATPDRRKRPARESNYSDSDSQSGSIPHSPRKVISVQDQPVRNFPQQAPAPASAPRRRRRTNPKPPLHPLPIARRPLRLHFSAVHRL